MSNGTNDGFRRGKLSFQVPGLEVPTEGTWISVANTADEVGVVGKTAFELLHKAASEEHSSKALDEILASLTAAL